MPSINSFNPEILPSKGSGSADHRKFIISAILAAIAMAIIGFTYWWMVQKDIINTSVSPDDIKSYRDDLIYRLEQQPQSQASSEQIKTIQSKISSKPDTTPTVEEKAAIIEKLNSSVTNN